MSLLVTTVALLSTDIQGEKSSYLYITSSSCASKSAASQQWCRAALTVEPNSLYSKQRSKFPLWSNPCLHPGSGTNSWLLGEDTPSLAAWHISRGKAHSPHQNGEREAAQRASGTCSAWRCSRFSRHKSCHPWLCLSHFFSRMGWMAPQGLSVHHACEVSKSVSHPPEPSQDWD